MEIFRNPEAFFLLLLIPLFVLRHVQGLYGDGAAVTHPAVFAMGSRGRIWHHLLFLVKMFAFACLIVALARPQKALAGEDVINEGVDIIIDLDISGSMDARDFKPNNRLEVAKQVVQDFIKGRRADRIGLVVFASQAVTRCPLTIDYDVLLNLVETTRLKMLPDGTAIGNSLATALSRIRESRAVSRVIILVTDGVNNSGEIDPLTAAEMARTFGVTVYTIGVGSRGEVPYPVRNPYTGREELVPVKVDLDEQSLQEIARRTGGQYFRAVDPAALRRIFKQIDALEKSEIKIRRWTTYSELFSSWLLGGMALLGIWLVLTETLFRRIP
ncbi:MAG: VWA domain-containing protein [Acidobacteria bacterium]|nr:VWA domain-containing protein [Acidobacteriota bacterium]